MQFAPGTPTIDDVRAAAGRVAGEVTETPCMASRTLSAICGCEVFLKFENLQFTASFKERGAFNKLAQLTDEERRRGVLAVSAGNHAQAVAFHAERMGIDYKSGQQVRMNTANGVAPGWRVKLNSVRIGDVEIYDVEAIVGLQPMTYVLLGNSFLTRFQMKRDNDQMTLERRY